LSTRRAPRPLCWRSNSACICRSGSSGSISSSRPCSTASLSEEVRKTHTQLRRAGYDSLWHVAACECVRS
jgi:hypothetical protein